MASSNATFHAKITADASEFVQQVESAGKALEGLVGAYDKAGKASATSATKAASKSQQNAGKEAEDVYSKAESAAKQYFATVQAEERELAAARKSSAEAVTTGAQGNAGEFVSGYKPGGSGADREAIQQRMLYDKLGKEIVRKDREHDQNLKQIAKTHETIGDRIYEQVIAKNRIRETDKAELAGIKSRLMQQDKMNKLQDEAMRENSRRTAIDNRQQLDAMVTGRYALYDMANAYQGVFRVAQRVTAELIKTIGVAGQFESSFTAVERALQLENGSAAFNDIRQVLVDLSTEIPVTFDELSQIAALGAQMGVSAQNIESFTKTISAFTATTGVSIDDAAEKFGRIAALLNVPIEDFENLGAAVLFAGYNAVATEAEILSMTQSIAASASTAGMAADETVGLATALSSLGLAPELSRGSLQRIFAEINRAVAGTSEYMDEFSRAVGLSEEEAAYLWKEDPSQFFNSLLSSLEGAEDLTSALDQLGIINIRDVELITRLSQNYDVYTKSMDDATDSYARGIALTSNYNKVADNLESKLQILVSSFMALQDAIAAPTAEFLKPILDGLVEAIKAVTRFAKTDLGKVILPVSIAITAAIAAFAGLNFVMNIAVAQTLAMRTAMIKMNQMSGTMGFGIKALTGQLLGNVYAVKGANDAIEFLTKAQINNRVASGLMTQGQRDLVISAGRATIATRGLSVAIRALGLASGIGLVLTLGSIALEVARSMGVFSKNVQRSEDDLRSLGSEALQASGGLKALMDSASTDANTDGYKTFSKSITGLTEDQEALALELEKVVDISDDAKSAFDGSGDSQDRYGDSVRETNKALEEQLSLTPASGAIIIDALASTTYEKDGQMTSFFLEQIRNPEIAAVAKLLGFDIGEAVNAGLSEDSSATEYFAKYKTAFNLLETVVNESHLTGPMGLANSFEHIGGVVGLSAKEVENAYNILKNSPDVDFSFFQNGVDLIDGYVLAAGEAYAANELLLTSGGTGAVGEEIKSRTEATKDYLQLTNLVINAAHGEQAAFETLAKGIQGTTGALFDLDESSRTNMQNFTNYVVSAYNAAELAGEGPMGSLQRIGTAITAMGLQGIDTSQMLIQFQSIAENALGSVGTDYATMLTNIAKAPDLASIRALIIAFYQAQIAMAETKEDAAEFVTALQRALWALTDGSKTMATSVVGSAKTARTALEKLQDQIEKVFNWTNKQMSINSSLRGLGKSLEENGNTFSIWSEAGEGNVNSLMGVIDQLAIQSGGDMQKFANLLASLRKSLVDAGVGASGLRYIDIAMAKTGKTGKVTTKIVDRFTNSLKDIGSAEDEIKSVEEAINAVANAATSGIKSRFSEAFAIDDITLGWLSMSDAAADAAKEIEGFQENMDSANESITNARIAIQEAEAAILSLTADKGKLEYQLDVALRYGDTLRADQIRGEIAKIDADIAKENDNISDSNNDISKSYRDIAEAEQGIIDVRTISVRETIEANRALTDMAEKYAQATAHMIINADEGEDLNQIIEDQVEAFKNNAIQMGYTEEQAGKVADILRDELIKSMDEIPENIETDIVAKTDAALLAVTSFVGQANARLATIKDRHVVVTTSFVNQNVPIAPRSGGGGGGGFLHASSGGLISGAGTGTSDSIAAKLSNGEYVVKASAVEHYGIPFLNALNQTKLTSSGMSAPSGGQSSGSQMVYLSPEDRQLLRSAVDRPIALYTDNTVIAKSANAGNQILAQRGSK